MAFNDLIRLGASAAGDYEIERSLRFNSADSANLTYTPGSDGNLKKFTFSFWFKKGYGTTGGTQSLFSGYAGSGGFGTDRITIFAGGELQIEINGPVGEWRSKRLLRDPTAWYHIVGAFDTSQAAVGDRAKFYLNGTQITDWDSSYNGSGLTQDHSLTGWNNAGQIQQIGSYAYQNSATGSSYIDGYYADFYFIDDQQLTPASFGETNEDTGQWVPKKYSGTYNSKSYFLNFKDNSGTTTTTLGKDSSGNSNNFTCNNFSVAAGAGNDSLEDTPNNNFCTWNSTFIAQEGTVGTLSNGSLDYSNSGSSGNAGKMKIEGTMYFPSSGKWYMEMTDLNNRYIGIGSGTDITTGYATKYIQLMSGHDEFNDGSTSGAHTSWVDSDVIGCGYDIDNQTVKFYKNGTLIQTYTGVTTSLEYRWFSQQNSSGSAGTGQANFGQRPFHTLPAGYKALCAANLPEPTIIKSTDFFNVNLWSGNAGTQSITMDFQPDMVWNKCRTATHDHQRWDALRGVTKSLRQDTEVEATHADGLTAFNSNGFTLGANSRNNGSGETYVGWSWKESATAGFDIVKDEGTGSDHTIAHSLGVKPDMMIRKAIDRVDNWQVYHKDLDGADATEYLEFNSNAVQQNYHEIWNDTPPTSSVFTVGSDTSVNEDDKNYITYLFSSVDGFSKVGRYTGNGSATDGVFVYLGFKPAFLLMKRINTAENWVVVDNKRDPDNPVGNYMLMNTNAAAADGVAYDFLSNGVKFRGSSQNEDDEAYVYIAFAERPFKYANAR